MHHLLRYLSSFSSGRIRLRHPALGKAAVVAEAEAKLQAISGFISAKFTPKTCSVLVLYDAKILSQTELLALAEPFAEFLDAQQ